MKTIDYLKRRVFQFEDLKLEISMKNTRIMEIEEENNGLNKELKYFYR